MNEEMNGSRMSAPGETQQIYGWHMFIGLSQLREIFGRVRKQERIINHALK